MTNVKTWRPCCPYREGLLVEWNGQLWIAARRTGKGEIPGESGAWRVADVPAVDMARAVDPRSGQGL